MAGSDDDKGLMERFGREGDLGAFEELVRHWEQPVLRFFTKATGDFEAAKDLRQEVFVRVYRHGAVYDPRFAFSTWLFRISGNVLKTWLAKQGRRRLTGRYAQPVPTDLPDVSAGPRVHAQRAEIRERIGQAMLTLPVEERELVLLKLDLGLAYREIGEIQNVPEPTVKSRFYVALKRLRAALTAEGSVERSHEL